MATPTLLVVAGVPSIIKREFARVLPNRVEQGRRQVIWSPLPAGGAYTESYVDSLYQQFGFALDERQPLSKRRAASPNQIGAVFVYLEHHGYDSSHIYKIFGVETIILPIKAPTLSGRSLPANKKNNAANELAKAIRRGVRHAEKLLEVIGNEVTNRRNHTPLLLPVDNYGPETVWSLLSEVHCAAAQFRSPEELKARLRELERSTRYSSGGTKFYQTSSGLQFLGTTGHGMPVYSEGSDHKLKCIIRARLRTGASFDPSFHYDCTKTKGAIPRNWKSCHAQKYTLPKGRRHANIAPNDYVR